MALDSTYKKNYKERLEPLRDKRMVFIFDECHRSQFGENHKAIKEFFPNAQLFGFTGTPIFERMQPYSKLMVKKKHLKPQKIFLKSNCTAYTITHAIEDRNVLKFHIDYFKGKALEILNPEKRLLNKRCRSYYRKAQCCNQSTQIQCVLATASINNAIEYLPACSNNSEEEIVR